MDKKHKSDKMKSGGGSGSSFGSASSDSGIRDDGR